MQDELERICKRMEELARRAEARGCWVYSDFLSLGEQQALRRLRLDAPWQLAGGFEGAERCIVCFGSETLCYDAFDPPIACLAVEPANARFAEPLGHRDVLGALMSLGLERTVLGDVLVKETRAWVFCCERVADTLCRELRQVRRTTVRCVRGEAPSFVLEPPEATELAAASERLDAVAAAVWQLSRAEARALVTAGQVFVNGLAAQKADAPLQVGELVSVRGKGRFRYEGPVRQTRSGRLRVSVRIY